MKKFQTIATRCLPLATTLITFAALSLNAQTPTPSPDGLKLVTVTQRTLDLASKALDELEQQDKLVAGQEKLIASLEERLATEKHKAALTAELAESRRREADALVRANKAATEALYAKDGLLANKDKEIEILKKKKTSFLKIVQYVATGIAIGFLIK